MADADQAGAERVRLTLRETGPGPPAVVRLRGALKCLLRTFGLRCVSIEEVGEDTGSRGSGPGDQGEGRGAAGQAEEPARKSCAQGTQTPKGA
jgi:hypothetical protein